MSLESPKQTKKLVLNGRECRRINTCYISEPFERDYQFHVEVHDLDGKHLGNIIFNEDSETWTYKNSGKYQFRDAIENATKPSSESLIDLKRRKFRKFMLV